MTQEPKTGDFLLKWRGDTLLVTLRLDAPRSGRAAFRTNLGRASVHRREIVDETERGLTPLDRAWTDIPLAERQPGVFSAEIALDEVGVFSGKACFFPDGGADPEWPAGENLRVKVESAETRKNNSVYCVFPRQFGSFREIVRRLPHIMDAMGFRIIQTLPPFPVPTSYGVMGEYGCPFAATDFLSVDPAMAEFDTGVTPLGQFKELVGAVHAKGGLFFLDLPANHTGWASTLQTHHPEWFRRESDGRFHSPGAWGVTWADLVELDYANAPLRAYMADVFLFWCRIGVDGFRCDAGYMIPRETWTYIVAKVREEYPDTVFLLEGLGGQVETTDRLLADANLDWAYSEMFQTYDRRQFEWYLPLAIARAERYGTLIHFAETHDNDRLAKGGEVYARLRVQLAALLSWQGAWGIANGVEWYCRDKIDVHGKTDLNWGAEQNMVELIARLNALLNTEPTFTGACHLQVVTRGDGNTLAVVRRREGFSPVLVLANLDCAAPATVFWDAAAFSAGTATDLLKGRQLTVASSQTLAPGEVLCLLSGVPSEAAIRAPADARGGIEVALRSAEREAAGEVNVHIVLPRDVRRDVVVPAGAWVEVSAKCPFRMRIVVPEDGRTLRVYRSAREKVVCRGPDYVGDGTHARILHLDITRYVDGRALRARMRFLVPPPADAARVRLALDGTEVRADPGRRAILSNGAGASSQVRVSWGEICSQYDAFLAANPNPNVPSDRLVLWTRTRCWLQREGYNRALNATCVTRFETDPAGTFARWLFRVPCGLGREAAFSFVLTLARGANAARLAVTRTEATGNDVGGTVRLVFRPDLEWRSFHAATKAYQGAQRIFQDHIVTTGKAFDFAPYDGAFRLAVENGVCNAEPSWTYDVAHAEEAARAQEPSGDLFSPGWISADLRLGESVRLVGSYRGPGEATPVAPVFPADDLALERDVPVETALRRALDLYVVRRDNLKTVIAGYPWFLDWGRDTFIFLRGMIAAGRLDESLQILRAFAAFEECGTLPNIINGERAANRDTTDAPLWFIRCVQEIAALPAPGGAEAVSDLLPACRSIVAHYRSGTPNGIRVDEASQLVFSPPHFTWMDTNYPACTPRVGYPIEIQALWISALRFLGETSAADKALDSVRRLFHWEHGYRDCLAAPHGEPADQAVGEDTIRPNQLFLITLGVLKDADILRATSQLLVPGGIRSLNFEHPLYRGTYAGDEDSSRKPAYHNGTVWTWPFPSFVEALVEMDESTRDWAFALLAGAVENLNGGCVGHVSEIADGDAPHAQKGCTAQAWGDSELLRVWLKLGGKGESER